MIPPALAARNLQECLLLQLMRQKEEGKEVDMAIQALTKYFDEFTKKHYEKIQRGLNLTDEELKEVMIQITKLNPKPGGQVGEVNKAESYVVPDFFIYNNGGKLELTLNSKNAPELRISEGYRDMLKDYDRGAKKDRRQKEAVLFIKQKIDAAKWFIDAIKQRQHTLLSTMTAIMNHQHDFFLTGDETSAAADDPKRHCRKNRTGYFYRQPCGQQQVCTNRVWYVSPQILFLRIPNHRQRRRSIHPRSKKNPERPD